MNDKAKVIKEIKYSYDGIINIGDIVHIIHVENDNIVIIKTKDDIKIRIAKDKIKPI